MGWGSFRPKARHRELGISPAAVSEPQTQATGSPDDGVSGSNQRSAANEKIEGADHGSKLRTS